MTFANKIRTFVLAFALLPLLGASAQVSKQELEKMVDSINSTFPREYIRFTHDRMKGMFPGDTLHFSLQVTKDNVTAQPNNMSRIAYVQLLTANGSIVKSLKLKLDSLACTSHWLTLDSIYPSGFYEVRAFTRYMTNWRDYQYHSELLPIYSIDKKAEMQANPSVGYLDVKGADFREEYLSRVAHPNYKDKIVQLSQPIENHLTVYGHIEHKAVRNLIPSDTILADRNFLVSINQGDTVLSGRVETDYLGRYALYFPDVKGDWNMRMFAASGNDDMARHRVTIDEPMPRRRIYIKDDAVPANFGMAKFVDDRSSRKYMFRHINCDIRSNRIMNQGSISKGLYEWLGDIDLSFTNTRGISSPVILNVNRDTVFNKYLDLNFILNRSEADSLTVCVDGPGYGNHPIVWIVDGEYRLVTNLNKRITDFLVLRPSSKHMPLYLDELKSIVITDNPTAFHPYVRSTILEKKKPITIFITLHENYQWDDSGLASTHFQGFDN